MLRRSRAPKHPVTLYLDGDAIVAERGEPIAAALLASDAVALARSPKLHRPRGPSCLRGACDGCLARVNGEPNIMTCMRPAEGGERIETQNVVGSRKADLLRVTDWFFPQGLDHHHFMAGVPAISNIMQTLARKVAGLGTLPDEPISALPAQRLSTCVLVIGGGPAGICAASRLRASGSRVTLVDDGLQLGGSLLGSKDLLNTILDKYPLKGVDILLRRTVAGIHLGQILIAPSAGLETPAGPSQGALIANAPILVFATGCHDGQVAFPNNDLPGILSARALCRLLGYGIEPVEPIVVAGEDPWADELIRRLPDRIAAHIPLSQLVSAGGTSRLRSVVLRKENGKNHTIKTQTLAIATKGAPAFEVAAQAGAQLEHIHPHGYAVHTDEHGQSAPGVWALGECTGKITSALELVALEAQVERISRHILTAMRS